jgi:hypothetical protein
MMDTLFDAQQAADEAIARAGHGAPAGWVDDAKAAVMLVACQQADFTTDDVWRALGDVMPPEPRALGAVMKALSKERKIKATGQYRKSVRVECHARPLAVWRLCV